MLPIPIVLVLKAVATIFELSLEGLGNCELP